MLEPGTAGGQFQGRRFAVAGGAALHPVADVGVLVAVEAGRCQQLIQELARTPDKRLAQLVLLGPWGLADQHQPRQGVTATDHHLLAALGQGATLARAALVGQGRQGGLEGKRRALSRARQAGADAIAGSSVGGWTDGGWRRRQTVDGAGLAGMARVPWPQGQGPALPQKVCEEPLAWLA